MQPYHLTNGIKRCGRNEGLKAPPETFFALYAAPLYAGQHFFIDNAENCTRDNNLQPKMREPLIMRREIR